MRYFLILFLTGFLFSCQTSPTKVFSETLPPDKLFGSSEESLKKFLSQKPVVLDAREPLDFSVSHPPGAISVQWREFSQTGGAERGWLLEDDFAAARRLSLWGIDPETPVLVVGYGPKGHGEEGRIAWMLKYLGVKDVQMADWKVVRSTIPREEGSPQNKPIWKPKVKDDYVGTWKEFQEDILHGPPPISGARMKALQMNAASSTAIGPEYVLLDVTDKADHGVVFPPITLIKRIFWKDFITEQGLPDQHARKYLEDNHITKNKVIYVISENGLSSSTVTFILREWGYMAKNFAGGYDFLRREIK
jgi:thiosulfate/3-mercaptopyruvate sulfurtransferase